VIPLGVLPHDAVLVESLLQPEVPLRLARADHAAWVRSRGDAGGDQHRQSCMPGRMDCAAVVLGSAVDVGSRRDRLAADRGAAERSVEVRMFMRNGDQLRCLAALSLGLGDRFLIEADLGAGGEEHELHARLGHRRDDGLAVVRNGDIHPLAALVTAAAGMVHGFILCL